MAKRIAEKACIATSLVVLWLANVSLARDELAVTLTVETQKVHRLEVVCATYVISNVSTSDIVLPLHPDGWDVEYRDGGVAVSGRFRSQGWEECPIGTVVLPPMGSLTNRTTVDTMVRLAALPRKDFVGDVRIQAVVQTDGKYWSSTDPDSNELRYSPCWSGRVCSAWIDITIAPIEDAADKAVIEMLAGRKDAFRNADERIWYLLGEDRRLYQKALDEYPRSMFAKYCDFSAAATRTKPWEWEDAVKHYRNVIEKYPVFQLTDDAKLGLAKVYLIPDCAYKDPAGTRAKALQLLESIVKDHPQSDSVTEARELLKKLSAIPISTGATNGVLRK